MPGTSISPAPGESLQQYAYRQFYQAEDQAIQLVPGNSSETNAMTKQRLHESVQVNVAIPTATALEASNPDLFEARLSDQQMMPSSQMVVAPNAPYETASQYQLRLDAQKANPSIVIPPPPSAMSDADYQSYVNQVVAKASPTVAKADSAPTPDSTRHPPPGGGGGGGSIPLITGIMNFIHWVLSGFKSSNAAVIPDSTRHPPPGGGGGGSIPLITGIMNFIHWVLNGFH